MDKLFGRPIRRKEAAQEVLTKPELKRQERDDIQTALYIQIFLKVVFRVALFGGVFLLYKQDFFTQLSPFLIKEILLMIVGLVFLQVSDFLASEYMWWQAGNTIRKYTNYSDNQHVDDKTYEQKKEMNKKNQKQPTQQEEYQENKDKKHD